METAIIFAHKQRLRIYIMHAVNAFALSMVAILVPVYLLTLGYSLEMTLLFILVKFFTVGVAAVLVLYISNKIGLLNILKLRFIILGIYLLLLYLLQQQSVPIMFIAIMAGFEIAFYWIPFNVLFTRNANEKMGRSVGAYGGLHKLVGIPGPIIGGAIAAFLGFPILFIVAFIVAIVAYAFIANIESDHTHFTIGKQEMLNLYRNNKKYFAMDMLHGMVAHPSLRAIWAIFIFLSISDVFLTGVAGTVIVISGGIFAFIVGSMTDVYDKNK